MFWDNDLVVLEKKDIKRVAGVFIIDDLKIVKLMHFTKTVQNLISFTTKSYTKSG